MKRLFILLLIFIMSTFSEVQANETKSANTEMSFYIPKYIKVESVLSPVLTANITDRTGNLHAPLKTKFRVTSNSSESQILYLKAKTITDAGQEDAIFAQGGRVYIAFGNITKIPKSSALHNCKIGSMPQDSPNVVAYPIQSISGPKHKFEYNKYEFEVKNGTSYVTVNVSPFINRSTFASNDANGFYQTTLFLTEADI